MLSLETKWTLVFSSFMWWLNWEFIYERRFFVCLFVTLTFSKPWHIFCTIGTIGKSSYANVACAILFTPMNCTIFWGSWILSNMHGVWTFWQEQYSCWLVNHARWLPIHPKPYVFPSTMSQVSSINQQNIWNSNILWATWRLHWKF